MARSPLQIQRPQVSLIRGSQLGQASGAGVPVPDIAGPLQQLAGRIAERNRRNQALEDSLAGQRAGAPFTGKDENGNYVALPPVDRARSPEWNAAAIATRENNFRATIRADLNQRFNEAMQDPSIDDETRLARMQGALQGVIDALPDEAAKSEAFQWGRLEIEQRRNTLASAAFNRQRQAMLDGIKQRIGDGTDAAISAAASGADPGPHRLEIFAAIDELVEHGEIMPETAEAQKRNLARFIQASAVQQTIATELFEGHIDPEDLDRFAEILRAGGDFSLERVAPREASPFERGPQARTRFYSTAELRDGFGDPQTTRAVAEELSRLAGFRKQELKAYRADRELFDTIASLHENQTLPAHLRDDFNKKLDGWIAAGVQDSPEGLAMMIDVTRRTKVMPQAFVDVMTNTILNRDWQQGLRMVEAWQQIRAGSAAGADVGSMVLRSIPAQDRATLDAAADAAQQIASTGGDAVRNADQWKRFQEKTRDPENTVERSVRLYNDAREDQTDPTFASELIARFRDEYSLTMPLDFQQEFERAFHVTMTMSNEADPTKAFDATWERVKLRWQASDIYEGGIVRGEPLTNPDGWNSGQYRSGAFEHLMVDEHQWLNDYVKDQLAKARDRGELVLTDEDRDILQGEVLASDLPLGEAITLEATGTDQTMPQFHVLLSTPGGKMRLAVKRNGVVQPLLLDPGIVRAHFNSKAAVARQVEELEKAAAGQREDIVNEEQGVMDLLRGREPASRMDEEAFRRWFMTRPPEWREFYDRKMDEIEEGLKESIRRLNERVIEVPRGVDIGPTHLFQPRAAGPDVTGAAVAEIERILPDGTGGQFLMNVASVESDFGRAGGTFRESGDRGIMQINTGPDGAFREVKRRAAIPGTNVHEAARKLKRIGIDVAGLQPEDLDRPIVSVAMARLYMLTDPNPIPADVEGQAELWKDHYNTWLGAGSVSDFVRKAGRAIVPQAIAGPVQGIPGAIIDMAGKPNPKNFLAASGELQAAALRLSSVFGKELRITPHGGTQADARAPTSQHRRGRAIDVYIADYSDADRTRLIALAIAQGFRGIGGYAAGDGKGTLHFDIRGGGSGPGGLALWWRKTPGRDGPWDGGPKWFRDGVTMGLRMRSERVA